MGLCRALIEEGFKLGLDNLWHPPNEYYPNRERDRVRIITLLRSELVGDRDHFIQVFGRCVANLLDDSVD